MQVQLFGSRVIGPRAVMRRFGLAGALALAAAGGTLGIGAAPATAYVQNCAAAADPGCLTAGYHTYQESRSQKSGAAAAAICVALFREDRSWYHPGACAPSTTFVRICSPHIPPQALTGGMHWGSSSAWTVDGRSATASDANVCVA
jgi:hypothetical protein